MEICELDAARRELARRLAVGPPAPPPAVVQALWERRTLDAPRQQPSAKRNLVLIYLESFERTYFDQELFGDMASRYPGQFVVGRDLDVY